jgi:hypothetical protein
LYRPADVHAVNPPEAFLCCADNGDHAEERCRNAYPNCDVLWTHLGDVAEAYRDYWDFEEDTIR